MSVRAWKRVITLFVITIILILSCLTVFLTVRVSSLSGMIEEQGIDGQGVSQEGTTYSLEYQNLYPQLYVENDYKYVTPDHKVCYLTFDDGPHIENTTAVLDTLKENNAKATFFVIYQEGEAMEKLYKRIVDEGHTIAVHTASHKYYEIYASVEAYLEDFAKISDYIESVTGVKPELFRFPGGSVNSYNVEVYQEIIAEMTRRGYTFYDWNVSSGDAAGANVAVDRIVTNSLKGNELLEKIVLMHDGAGHQNTVRALPQIIEGMKSEGYVFEGLNKDVQPTRFGYYS